MREAGVSHHMLAEHASDDPRRLRMADSGWDFRGADTRYATHGIFRYPAMMVAPVVRRLIEDYSPVDGGGRLLDPFCGSGSALVEAMLHGMESCGVDLNPLAILMARVKTSPLSGAEIERAHRFVRTRLAESNGSALPPDFPALEFWYSRSAARDLAKLRAAIEGLRSVKVRRFLELAFAETARYVSWTRRDEYKTYRLPDAKRAAWNPDVIPAFDGIVARNAERMADMVARLPPTAPAPIVIEGDARTTGTVPEGPFDLILTSPPYGDSRTTVAYGQYSSLPLRWLGFDRTAVNRTDRASLGGRGVGETAPRPESRTLDRHLQEIRRQDPERAREVLSFYSDLCLAFRVVVGRLATGGRACIVVGNRTVKGVRLETDVILSELLQNECGLRHLETIVRGIPNKVMPLRNSPTNVVGALGETMAHEYVLILERPKI